MDEALRKSGDWPNVAIPAGSDPHEVMKKYGVNEHTLRTACYDHEQHIRALKLLVKELWRLIDEMYRLKVSPSINTMAEFEERIEKLGIEVGE